MAKTSQKILDFVKQKEIVTTKEIKKHINLSDRAVYKQLKNLVNEKKLFKYGEPPRVYYSLADKSFKSSSKIANIRKFKITKQMQIKELVARVPPILNVDIVIFKEGKFLLGERSRKKDKKFYGYYLFPGGRMHFEETPQETAYRILKDEVPGVKANLRKLITAISGKGADHRANGVTLFYLFDYVSGNPQPTIHFDTFKWASRSEIEKDEKSYWINKQAILNIDSLIREMNNSSEEVLVEVDYSDKEVGTILKREAHTTNKRGHRAAHIVVFNSKGQTVLHQRSWSKGSSGGWWDMFGGHQVYGQTIDQTAISELAEELGVKCDLTFVRKMRNKRKDQLEFSYLYWGVSDGPYGFDRNEVEQIGTFDCEKLLKGDYDKDYKIIPHVKTYVKDLRRVWEKIQGQSLEK